MTMKETSETPFECGETYCGARTIAYAQVGTNNRWTQNTKQIVNKVTLGAATAMVIAQYENDTGYYLFGDYSDGNGSDTYHADLEEAVEQMDYEYENLSENIVWVAKPEGYKGVGSR